MNNKRPTQAKRILEYMQKHGEITALEAMRDLGCTRLSARIFELRESGFNIKSEFVDVVNRYGEKCRVKKYRLME